MFVRNRRAVMPPPLSPNKEGKMVHFGFCAVSSMIWVGGGGGWGGVGLF